MEPIEYGFKISYSTNKIIPSNLLISLFDLINNKLEDKLAVSDILDYANLNPVVPLIRGEEIGHIFKVGNNSISLFSSSRPSEGLREREYDEIREKLLELFKFYINDSSVTIFPHLNFERDEELRQ